MIILLRLSKLKDPFKTAECTSEPQKENTIAREEGQIDIQDDFSLRSLPIFPQEETTENCLVIIWEVEEDKSACWF